MTRYAVGDLQGCFDPLRRVLDRVKFDATKDQLWSVGDIVNRGTQSLECLRFLYELGASVRVVLGNHDLHLLAVAYSAREMKRGDTLQSILDAPDANELLAWVRQQPLFYRETDYAMVHAGLAPQWTLERASQLAEEIQQVLQSAEIDAFLHGMYGDTPDCWRDDLTGIERWRVITNYLTRMRFCDSQGKLDLKNKAGPEAAKPGFMPWFDVPDRKSAGSKLIVGHWATLMGRTHRADVFALDTGCIWGEQLSLLNLETQALIRCEC